jgi:hypothetical protein
MKKVLFVLMFVSIAMSAQKVKVVKGDYGFLKGQTAVNVEFVYDNLKVMKENLTDEEYVKERSNELNEKSKGKGDTWAKKWYSSRDNAFEPKFIELINVVLVKQKREIDFQEGLTDAKYTLVVDLVWVYPGYNVMVSKKGAKVSTVLKFVETANRENVVLEMTSENAPGDVFGGSFSNEDRIAEGYAKTGKTLAVNIAKALKKMK